MGTCTASMQRPTRRLKGGGSVRLTLCSFRPLPPTINKTTIQELFFDYFPPAPSIPPSPAATTYTPPSVPPQPQQCGADGTCSSSSSKEVEEGGPQQQVVFHAHTHHYPQATTAPQQQHFPHAAVDFLSKTEQWDPSPLAKARTHARTQCSKQGLCLLWATHTIFSPPFPHSQKKRARTGLLFLPGISHHPLLRF